MKKSSLLLALLVAVGCTVETGITDGSPVTGEANPPELEPPTRTDRIVQVTTPEVDVLFVIDNSCSMEEEQVALTNNFDAFIGYFVGSGLDWHVGVVSTDMDDQSAQGKLRQAGGFRFLDESAPQPVDMFTQMAHMGTSGAWTERGRDATFAALESLKDSYNQGFYRDEASLSVVVISDEDDYSTNISLQEFISWLVNLKDDAELVNFSSIVNLHDPPCPPISGYPPEVGEEYLAATAAVGGITWSICDPNWDTVLNELGMQAAGLKREFFLADIPVPETLDVWVVEPSDDGGNTYSFKQGRDYEYNPTRNSIRFLTYVPRPLSEVYIDYDLLSAQTYQEAGDDTGL